MIRPLRRINSATPLDAVDDDDFDQGDVSFADIYTTDQSGGNDNFLSDRESLESYDDSLNDSYSSSSSYSDSSSEDDDNSTTTGGDRASNASSVRTKGSEAGIHWVLGRREMSRICQVRSTLLVVLMVATIAICVLVHTTATHAEYQHMEAQFTEHATKIMDSFVWNVRHEIGELDSLAVSITSYTTTVNASWPLVTIPEFQMRASSTRKLANAEFLALVTLLEPSQREAWESFVINHVENFGFEKVITETATSLPQETILPSSFNDTDTDAADSLNNNTRRTTRRNLEEDSDDDEAEVEQPDLEELTENMESLLKDFFQQYEGTTATQVNTTAEGIATSLWKQEGLFRVVINDTATAALGNDQVSDGSENNASSHPYLAPLGQVSPALAELVNWNVPSHGVFGPELDWSIESQQVVIGKMVSINTPSNPLKVLIDQSTSTKGGDQDGQQRRQGPYGALYYPLFDRFDPAARRLVSALFAIIEWVDYLQAPNLPEEANGIVLVLSNDCGQVFTFQMTEDGVVYVGNGDVHDNTFDSLEVSLSLSETLSQPIDDGSRNEDMEWLSYHNMTVNEEYCNVTLSIYPSTGIELYYLTSMPLIYVGVVLAMFSVLTIAFLYYDTLIEKKQQSLVDKALRSHQIVTSLFPSNVRDRLFGDNTEDANNDEEPTGVTQPLLMPLQTEKTKLKSFLNSSATGLDHSNHSVAPEAEQKSSKPIADLFAHCTVFFADIAGFTAWSSARDPAQVFTLLEGLYSAFDQIALKRRVFKVETIGDSYMAVTGLPEPQPNHATIMIRFSRECLKKFKQVTRMLLEELGPGTEELALRVGVHSGPVTAGVLRGQKSRFQLFGDTVNTASRMESTGKPGKIQCSQATYNCLMDMGKGNWCLPREEVVEAKGKGVVQTYWVSMVSTTSSTTSGQTATSSSDSFDEHDLTESKDDFDEDGEKKPTSDHDVSKRNGESTKNGVNARQSQFHKLSSHEQRLVGWTRELLSKLLKQIVAHRVLQQQQEADERSNISNLSNHNSNHSAGSISPVGHGPTGLPRDEYSYSIEAPKFVKGVENEVDASTITLPDGVEDQLRDYVSTIAHSYQENPFHNFEHASHVTMSVNKILKRIMQAEDLDRSRGNMDTIANSIHNFTYGITSDPLTHFSCVFSAMIHDVDHPGVGNPQLVKEKDEMALAYNNKSVAEQNSIDIAWDLLNDPFYDDLRKCIFVTEAEGQRFRKLLVNSVMATDIFDPDLMRMRNDRWSSAFADNAREDAFDLKATIVIEHIIQASDVAHTMQHWHVYQKWNQRLFEEQYKAYVNGRQEKDPSEGWYKGELWFYDNYIIPLARKLKDCGVFGVASDEFLSYAMDNRTEWEGKGEQIVQELKVKAEETFSRERMVQFESRGQGKAKRGDKKLSESERHKKLSESERQRRSGDKKISTSERGSRGDKRISTSDRERRGGDKRISTSDRERKRTS